MSRPLVDREIVWPASVRGRPVWAAFTYSISVTDLYGAQQLSPYLHWTQGAARLEAEEWAISQYNGKIHWQLLGDDMAIGRIGDRVFVVRAILLPLERPPRK
jgi:hypothetical protein